MSLNFNVITLYPDFIKNYFSFGVLKKAQDFGVLKLKIFNLRNYSQNSWGSVDDRPYGGGDGMVLRPEPLALVIKELSPCRTVAFSPWGKTWKDSKARQVAQSQENWALICGRFSGMDQRFLDLYVQEFWSLGDFIMSGGELSALAVLDSVSRLLPGVLGHENSPQEDSFSPKLKGQLEYPVYTRPSTFEGLTVPSVLLSGDHEKISSWREEQSFFITQKYRPDLLK